MLVNVDALLGYVKFDFASPVSRSLVMAANEKKIDKFFGLATIQKPPLVFVYIYQILLKSNLICKREIAG